ncbi:MAG TPA: SOS response-associated peptidase [Bacteroidales bacterium]|nr:SOS response-associated peptidase [Bacteroidales bacterium]
MCFSVNVNLVKEELENRYGAILIDHDNYRPSYYYHAFAIPDIPVICSDDRSSIKLYKWGLIPSFIKNFEDAESIRIKTFNARAESISEKPAFSSLFRTKRCIVPVKGFFEWQHVGKEKVPWYIYHSENEIISLAGLYDCWVFDKTGEVFNTFTIITTEANDLLAEIHNSARRMPAIIVPGDENSWLDSQKNDEDIYSMLKPSPVEMLKAHTIGPLVNKKNADKNTPELIKPYLKPVQKGLF